MKTDKIKLVIFAITVIAVAMFLIPIAINSSFDAATDNQLDAFPGCVVAGGATDVVLTEDLLDANTIYVIAITATGAGAVPVANTYTAGTNTLNVTGLGVDTPQDLTVNYSYDAVEDYNGVGPIIWIVPLLVILGLIFVVVLPFWQLKQKG